MYATFIQIDGVVIIGNNILPQGHEMQLTWSGGPQAQVISSIVQLVILPCRNSLQNIIQALQLYNCTYVYVHRVLAKYYKLSLLYCWCLSGRFCQEEGFQTSHRVPLCSFPTGCIIICHIAHPRQLSLPHHHLKWLLCPKPYHNATEKPQG